MGAFDLAKLVRLHNRSARTKIVLWVAATIPLWYLSYWIVRLLLIFSVGLLAGRQWVRSLT